LGLLLGEPSGGLVGLDRDAPGAQAAAPAFLPPTGWISGGGSAPRSHYWYEVDDPPARAAEKFLDPFMEAEGEERAVLLEVRSSGGMTVAPPGLHVQSGEEVCWQEHTAPARVRAADLRKAAARLAACALLARHWPAAGRGE